VRERTYPATVAGVIDGDTLDVVVDLGFNRITTTERLRLDGINCPDLPHIEAKTAATAFTTRWCARNRFLLVRTRKTAKGSDEREKYGRIVATVLSESTAACLNDDLVHEGHAVRKSYA
jgi:micrococcal nuclease